MSSEFIDKYEIISTLGRGSMGVVYKGRDPEIGRLVAIKTLKSVFLGEDASGTEAMQRFQQESRSAGKLYHRNIVTIFEAGKSQDGSPYIVMEYVEGKSIDVLIAESGPMPVPESLHYLAQIASAIDYAHSQGVIHRDIKPSNIVIDERHRPLLLDFGVAKISDTSLTPAGTVVGTPSYMSPEQIRGSDLDGRTDVFSLAVVLFEMLTGVRPFPGSDFTTVVSNIIHKPPLCFAEVGAPFGSDLEHILAHGLEKDREQRFDNALAFIDAAAETFGAAVDGTGLVGGFKPGMSLDDIAQRKIGTKVNGGFPSSGKLTAVAVGSKSSNGVVNVDEVPLNLGEIAEPQVVPSSSKASPWFIALGALGLLACVGFLFISLKGRGDVERVVTINVGEEASNLSPSLTQGTGVSDASSAGLGVVGSRAIDEASVDGSGRSNIRPRALMRTAEGPEELIESSDESTKSLRSVVEELNSKSPRRGSTSVEAVAAVDAALVELSDERLIELLGAEFVLRPVLRRALNEAGRRASPRFTQSLLRFTKDKDFVLRAAGVKGLIASKQFDSDQVVETFERVLREDSEAVVRAFAAKGLGRVGTAKSKLVLESQLANERDELVRRMIRKALAP